MSSESAHLYWKAITAIEARELLNQIEVTSFSDMKKGDRKKLLSSLKKQAYPQELREKKQLSTEEIVGLLMR